MKGFTRDNKFIPMTDYKKVTRKSRDQKAKTQGVKIERKAREPSVEALLLQHGSENSVFERRLKEAKRQNQGYEQLMETLHESILEGQKNNEDVTFFQNWLRRVVDAERVRPDKSFYYHWVTREVEDIIEENPNIKFDQIKKKIDSLDADATDKQIKTGIEVLESDGVIKSGKSGFKLTESKIRKKSDKAIIKEIFDAQQSTGDRLVDKIRHGDKVTIVLDNGQQITGKAVMKSSAGDNSWVINTGGEHGRPAIAGARNVIKVVEPR